MMVRRLAVAAVAASLLVSALGRVGLGQPAPAATTQLGLASADPAVFTAAKNAGARAVKIPADWSAIEAKRGDLLWADLDRVVAAAIRDGLAPIIVLTSRAGVSRVTIERPTGDRHNSPVVCSR